MSNMNSLTRKHQMCSGWARMSFSSKSICSVDHESSNPLMKPVQSIPFIAKKCGNSCTAIKRYTSSSV